MRAIARLVAVLIFVSILTADLIAQNTTNADSNGNGKKGRDREVPTVKYDHLNDGPTASYHLTLTPGRPFIVSIENTYPDGYEYEIAGIPLVTDTPATATSGVKEEDLETKQLTQTHEATYGGYIVRIKSKAGEVDVLRKDGKTTTLPDATLAIAVNTSRVDYEVSGAFTWSGLTNPVFALETRRENDQDVQYVVRDRSAEDEDRLGIGAFTHVFHTSFPHVALTFGLGITDQNEVTYYAGPSWRVGDKAAITLGVTSGSVNRLPAGVKVDRPAPNANVLSNLGKKTERSWFVGLSYTFLNPGDRLHKPFAGAESKAGTPPETGTPAAKPSEPAAPVEEPDPFDQDGDRVPKNEDLDDKDPKVGKKPPQG